MPQTACVVPGLTMITNSVVMMTLMKSLQVGGARATDITDIQRRVD